MSEKSIVSFICQIFINIRSDQTGPFNKNRHQGFSLDLHQDLEKERWIKNIIRTSITEDQLESCRGWFDYLYKKRIISSELYSYLIHEVDCCSRDINDEKRPIPILPYQLERQKKIQERERLVRLNLDSLTENT